MAPLERISTAPNLPASNQRRRASFSGGLTLAEPSSPLSPVPANEVLSPGLAPQQRRRRNSQQVVPVHSTEDGDAKSAPPPAPQRRRSFSGAVTADDGNSAPASPVSPHPRRRSVSGAEKGTEADVQLRAAALGEDREVSPASPTLLAPRPRRKSVGDSASAAIGAEKGGDARLAGAAETGASPTLSTVPSRPRRKSVGDLASNGHNESVDADQEQRRQSVTSSNGNTPAGFEALGCGIAWNSDELAALQGMERSTMKGYRDVGGRNVKIDLEVRVLSHTPKGDLKLSERLHGAKVAIVLGDYGRAASPWVGLVQPALHLYKHGFNILFIDIPSFGADHSKYLKHGPELLLNFIRQLDLFDQPHVLTRGLGGAVLMQALSKDAGILGETHMVYDMEFPRGRGAIFAEENFEKQICWDVTQVWFTYLHNNQDSRGVDEGTTFVHRLLVDCQRKLRDIRAKAPKDDTNVKPWDEILITEGLGFQGDAEEAISEGHNAVMFSKALLDSLELFFTRTPAVVQDGLSRGLITEKGLKSQRAKKKEEPKPVVIDDSMVHDIVAKIAQRKSKIPKYQVRAKKEMLSPDDEKTNFDKQVSPWSTTSTRTPDTLQADSLLSSPRIYDSEDGAETSTPQVQAAVSQKSVGSRLKNLFSWRKPITVGMQA